MIATVEIASVRVPEFAGIILSKVEAVACRTPIETIVRSSLGSMRERTVFVRVTDVEGRHGYGEVWCNFLHVGAERRQRPVSDLVGPLLLDLGVPEDGLVYTQLTARLHRLAIQSGAWGPLRQVAAELDAAVADLAALPGRRHWSHHFSPDCNSLNRTNVVAPLSQAPSGKLGRPLQHNRVGCGRADHFPTNGSYPAVGAWEPPVWNRPIPDPRPNWLLLPQVGPFTARLDRTANSEINHVGALFRNLLEICFGSRSIAAVPERNADQAAFAGASTPNEGLTRNLAKGIGLCRSIPFLPPLGKFLLRHCRHLRRASFRTLGQRILTPLFRRSPLSERGLPDPLTY